MGKRTREHSPHPEPDQAGEGKPTAKPNPPTNMKTAPKRKTAPKIKPTKKSMAASKRKATAKQKVATPYLVLWFKSDSVISRSPPLNPLKTYKEPEKVQAPLAKGV